MQSPKQTHIQSRLFQYIDMENIVPEKHILRRLKDVIDFSHAHDWVKSLYSERVLFESFRCMQVIYGFVDWALNPPSPIEQRL